MNDAKRPAEVTAAWVERTAISYLERYGSSELNLRRVLRARIEQRCRKRDEEPLPHLPHADDVVDALKRLGYVDDRKFSEGLIRKSRARGQSRAGIRARLSEKGVEASLADELLSASPGVDRDSRGGEAISEEYAEEDEDFEAAVRYARIRRFGPFCADPERRQAQRDKHLASLGRRGFSYGIACAIVDAIDPESLIVQRQDLSD